MIEKDQRVRVVGVHRLRGKVESVTTDAGAAFVLFDGQETVGSALYLVDELEPEAPCKCVWCSNG